MRYYLEVIQDILDALGRSEMPVRHVLAWILVGDRDLCSIGDWRYEIDCAIDCVEQSTTEESETLALSYGL